MLAEIMRSNSRARLRGAGELRQDEHAVPLRLARDEFEGDQVRPIAQRGDEHDVRAEVQRAQLLERHRLVEIMDRHVLERAERPVDARDELMHVGAKLLESSDLGARRNGDLKQDDLAAPLRVLLQEELERLEFVRDALDVIEPVDSEEHLLAVEPPLQIDDLILHRRLLKARLEAVWIDADGESVHSDGASRGVVKDAIGALSDALGAGHAEHSEAREVEVSRVVVDVKPDEVGAEDATQNLRAVRQRPVHL